MENVQQPKNLRELLAQLDAQGITDYRRYQQVRTFLSFKAREKNIPLSGTFELTPLCNLDCKMCYVHLNREQMQGAELLTVDTWKNIMQQAIDAGMMYACLTGGECLTYSGFKELYCFLQSKGVQVSVLSNGILMDESMVEFFKQHPPAVVQVTLYGASEEAYERVTGHRMFERVMTNLRRMKNDRIPLSIAVTPNAFMMDGEEIVRLLCEEDFHFSINAGLMEPRKETGRKTQEADAKQYADMLRLQRKLLGFDIGPGCDADSLPDPSSSRGTSPKGVVCGAGKSTFTVNWQGEMRPCNNFPCEPIDVLAVGFAEGWRQVNHIALNFQRPAECENCYYQPICKICVAEHAAGAPVGHASPAICAWIKYMVADGIYKVPVT